jgi:hypothetical protein
MKIVSSEWKAVREIATLAKECGELSVKHRELGEYYAKCSRAIQISIILLSGTGTLVNGLPLVGGITKQVVSSCCSATTGILSSIYVLLGLSKKSIKHDDVATGFKSLEKSLRFELLKPYHQQSDPLELIEFCETTKEKLLKGVKY